MYDDVQFSLAPALDREAILERLEKVIDPELDTSILKLGFVKSLEAENGHLIIELHLPTYWCAANFSYLMAFDTRRELLTVEGIQSVTVRLPDHFASKAIEKGVNAGQSFAEAFPEEASESLSQLRDLFLRKGYIKRQERLVRHLRKAGLSSEEILTRRLADVTFVDESCRIQLECGRVVSLECVADVARQYFERRAELRLDCSPTAPLVVDLRGRKIAAERLEKYLIRSRTVRVAMDANGAFCSAILAARKAGKDGAHQPTVACHSPTKTM